MQINNDQMDKFTNNMMQACTDMNALVRDTVNASLQSVSIVTKGCSDLCNSVSSLVQNTMEQSIKINKTLMNVTSVNDLMDTQNNVLKSSFDNIMSEVTNISQLSTRIAQQAAEPVTKQMNENMNKISKVRAA